MRFIFLLALAGISCGGSGQTDSSVKSGTDAATADALTADAADGGVVMTDACTVVSPEQGQEMVWVELPAGQFVMGCVDGDGDCFECEHPTRTVQVAAFAMTRTEITQAQWLAVNSENPSYYYDCADCPVEMVHWYEAREFCESLGGRLPSEAEWEYAARGGSETIFSCGDEESCLPSQAWYELNSCYRTQLVGQKAANGYGLQDMAGNVWEWVEDCWHEDYQSAPTESGVWQGGDCLYRVLRGGAFGVESSGLRSSNRYGDHPDSYFVPSPGFRCARNL